jgi:hypothetical protein
MSKQESVRAWVSSCDLGLFCGLQGRIAIAGAPACGKEALSHRLSETPFIFLVSLAMQAGGFSRLALQRDAGATRNAFVAENRQGKSSARNGVCSQIGRYGYILSN